MGFVGGNDALGERLAMGLLQIQAVEIRPENPFIWSSGWRSPIYCDNRLILSYPVLRQSVVDGLCEAVETYYPGTQVLAGTATAGIPHAAFISQDLGLPMAYVRSNNKSHGKKQRIEGLLRQGDRVVVVEDTISTGSSAFSAVAALREAGANVVGVLSIFSYDFDTAAAWADELQVTVCRLLGYQQLIDTAVARGYVSKADRQRLMEWRRDPANY